MKSESTEHIDSSTDSFRQREADTNRTVSVLRKKSDISAVWEVPLKGSLKDMLLVSSSKKTSLNECFTKATALATNVIRNDHHLDVERNNLFLIFHSQGALLGAHVGQPVSDVGLWCRHGQRGVVDQPESPLQIFLLCELEIQGKASTREPRVGAGAQM